MKQTDRKALIRIFAVLRFATGVAAWAAPDTAGKVSG